MVKFGHLYWLKLKGAHFSQLLRQRSIFWKSWDCLSYNCMQVYPDILACKYIRVHFLRFQSLQNTKYPLILACNTKRGNWVQYYLEGKINFGVIFELKNTTCIKAKFDFSTMRLWKVSFKWNSEQKYVKFGLN